MAVSVIANKGDGQHVDTAVLRVMHRNATSHSPGIGFAPCVPIDNKFAPLGAVAHLKRWQRAPTGEVSHDPLNARVKFLCAFRRIEVGFKVKLFEQNLYKVGALGCTGLQQLAV